MTAALEAGQEVSWCRYVLPGAGTPDGIDVARMEHATGGALSHHVIWYQMAQTPESVADNMAPFRCDGGIHLLKAGVLYAPPSGAGELTWPENVAAHLAPDAVTLLEWHVINPTPNPVRA